MSLHILNAHICIHDWLSQSGWDHYQVQSTSTQVVDCMEMQVFLVDSVDEWITPSQLREIPLVYIHWNGSSHSNSVSSQSIWGSVSTNKAVVRTNRFTFIRRAFCVCLVDWFGFGGSRFVLFSLSLSLHTHHPVLYLFVSLDRIPRETCGLQ